MKELAREKALSRGWRAGVLGVMAAGFGLMILLNLFPAGVVQLYDVVQNGYAHARSLDFAMHGFFHKSEWVRVIGDMTFIRAGTLPVLLGTILSVKAILTGGSSPAVAGQPALETHHAR